MNNDNSKILVLDGRSLATLAIARSLGSKGLEVHCGESFKTNLTSYSKYVKKRVTYPSPKDKPESFIHEILKVVQNEDYDLVLPVRDDTTLLLSKYKKEINKYTNVYLADYDKIKRLNDKGETIKIARDAGVPVPKTYFPEEIDKESIKKEIEYPALIRPRVSSGARGIIYVKNASDFDSAYKKVESNHGTPMIQEYVSHDGGHYSIGTLYDESSSEIASHVYLETKQYPTNGGPAVSATSIEKPEWTKKIMRIFDKIKWVGPAHVDVLYDISDDTPKLLEVNPRFWMSINIAIKSGVDFPYLAYLLSKGEKLEKKSGYRRDIRYRWLLPNEILSLVSDKNDHEEFKNFFRLTDGKTCYGSISKDDPMPAIGTILQSLDFLFDKEKRKIIFDRGW